MAGARLTGDRWEPSPSALARAAGALYLYIFVAGLFAEGFVRGWLIAPGDAAATASNILAHETLFRIGFSAELLHLACDVAIAAIFYVLFRPVSRTVAMLAAFMRLASAVVLAIASIAHFAALRLLSGADFLAALGEDEPQALALVALGLQADGYAVCLVFFGFVCLSLGWLILKSALIPRAIGWLLVVAGACYLVNSFAGFLSPAFAAPLFPVILLPAAVAELSLALWLLIEGVDETKWRSLQGG